MDQRQKHSFKIALVGVEFEENLSLRYLAGALMQAGFEQVTVQPYNSIEEAGDIADLLIREGYDLVGISMAFQVRAIDDMALVQLLRRRGFSKHITAGGQFATLHYTEIFDDCSGLNSIIRFEAETSIVTLANALLLDTPVSQVPGLVWKDAASQVHMNNAVPEPGDIDALALPHRKIHRTEALGLKRVQMIGSRGCHATCKYCCVSALATERRSASKDAGGLSAIPGTRRRTAVSVASEMAMLYFKHDIRIFEFQDDNWIHPKISLAIDYFTQLKNELDKRGVGQIGLTLKTRADSVQPDIIKVLKDIGLIRVFVGIESGTQNLLSKLGRKSRDNVSLQALQILREHKVPAYFNALLFGPDIKFNEIEPELEFLEQCADFPFEIVEVVIYGKTGLYLSLKQESRLHGNYLDYRYDYPDESTQLTHYLVSRLETRHFGVYSPIKMAADLGFNLGIVQVFYPGEFTDALAAKVSALNEKINMDQVRIIRKAAALAQQQTDVEAAKEQLIAETISADLQFYTEIIRLQNDIEQYVRSISTTKDVSSYYRVGALVQSGLIAGLFMMLSGQAQAQGKARVDAGLKAELVQYVYHPDAKTWKGLKARLMVQKTSILPYYYATYSDVDSIDLKHRYSMSAKVETKKELKHLEKKLNSLHEKRMKEDYDRLNRILQENNPKIKIASSLVFSLDEQGKVTAVSLIGTDKKKTLSSEMQQVIVELLNNKQFYAHEATKTLYGKDAEAEMRRRHKKERQRYRRPVGPLD